MLTKQQVEAIGEVLRAKFRNNENVVIDGGARLSVVRADGMEGDHA